jgi:TP901 family phage tail tape measure protein
MAGSIGDINVRIGAIIQPLEQALGQAERSLNRSGRKLARIGSELSTTVSLPIIAIGGASLKMASDFEFSMTKISSQVGRSVEEVDAMKDSVLALAGKTARSPVELADAMFFIQSAGIHGAEALQALEFSAKAAAAGFGDTAVVADLLTSAMNAYGPAVLSAEAATDILSSTVKEGKASAEALSGAMGSALPIASNMGVKFNEVGAAIAAMTRTGTGADEAVTQLNAIMTTFLKPSKEAEGIANDLGYSMEGLRTQIKEKGLLNTLLELTGKLKDSGIQTADFFNNTRALKGVLDLTGASAETNIAIFESLANSAGSAEEAFLIASGTLQFKMNKAMAQLQAISIQIGNILIPIASNIIDKFMTIANVFSNFSQGTKEMIVKVGLFVAAIGPVIFAIGKMKLALAAVLGAVKAAFSLNTLRSLLNPWTLGLAAIVGIAVLIVKNWSKVKSAIISVTNSIIDAYNNSIIFRAGIQSVIFVFKSLWNTAKTVLQNLNLGFSTIFESLKQALSGNFSEAKETLTNGFKTAFSNIKNLGNEIGEDFADAIGQTANSRLEHVTDEIFSGIEGMASDVQSSIGGAISDIGGGGGGVTSGGGGNKEAQKEYADILKSQNEGLKTRRELTIDALKAERAALEELKKKGIDVSAGMEGINVAWRELIYRMEEMPTKPLLPLPEISTIDLLGEAIRNLKDPISEVSSEWSKMTDEQKLAAEALEERLAKTGSALDTFNKSASDTINGALSDAFVLIGESVGAALANGDSFSDLMKTIGGGVLRIIADMMMDLGKSMIAYGIALIGFNKALESMNPYVAIAAGVALVAAGAFVMGKINKNKKGLAAGTQFWEGGSVMVGERGPEIVNMPRGSQVIPNNRLAGKMGMGGGGGVLSARISGRDLLLLLEKEGKRQARTG